MGTLAEIERAAEALPQEQQKSLLEWLSQRVGGQRAQIARPHSVLDIPTVSLGRMVQPLSADDDLLSEMLEGRL